MKSSSIKKNFIFILAVFLSSHSVKAMQDYNSMSVSIRETRILRHADGSQKSATLAADRIFVDCKGKTPVSVIYYGQAPVIPGCPTTVEANFAALERVFKSFQWRTFVETSSIPELQELAELTRNLRDLEEDEVITFNLQDTASPRNIFVSIKKEKDNFPFLPGETRASDRFVKVMPVICVKAYSNDAGLSPSMLNLLKALVSEDTCTEKILGKILAKVKSACCSSRRGDQHID